MGKLAVPEHILNKPGKLTSAEFDQMKLHAGIGADILSAIDFPYPVVPIVRHHHENWNGTGYPDGLCGQDIPIGARILSVADCFDALTSDRPYRRKLSDEEALNILRERRATMYDPLIVDTFLNLVDQIRPADLPSPHEVALAEISRSTLSGARPYGSAKYIDSSDVAVADRRTKSSRTKATDRLLDLHLAKWFPNSTSVTYVLESSSNELVTRSATGSHAQALERKRIALGKGISGWVAANHRLIMNSDAALDLGDTIPEIAGHCCMSAPLIDAAGNLLGVLTIYSSSSTPFTDGDRSVLEAAAYAEVIALSSQVPGIRLEVSNVRQLPR